MRALGATAQLVSGLIHCLESTDLESMVGFSKSASTS